MKNYTIMKHVTFLAYMYNCFNNKDSEISNIKGDEEIILVKVLFIILYESLKISVRNWGSSPFSLSFSLSLLLIESNILACSTHLIITRSTAKNKALLLKIKKVKADSHARHLIKFFHVAAIV